MKDAKNYDPNIDKAGYEEVPIGQKVEQVKNGGEGSGNFGHAGRPGEQGGSGEGGGGAGKGSAGKTAERTWSGEPAWSSPSDSDHQRIADVQTRIYEREKKGDISSEAARSLIKVSQSGDHDALVKLDKTLKSGTPLHYGSGVPGSGKSGGLIKEGTPLDTEGKPDTARHYGVKNADLMQPGTAFAPQGNKTEMVTNPPYQTPELGDAPEEMQKEADRIYKGLRGKEGSFHEETPAARESAARVMWTTLEKSWKKDKDGKWVKKEKSE